MCDIAPEPSDDGDTRALPTAPRRAGLQRRGVPRDLDVLGHEPVEDRDPHEQRDDDARREETTAERRHPAATLRESLCPRPIDLRLMRLAQCHMRASVRQRSVCRVKQRYAGRMTAPAGSAGMWKTADEP